MLTILEFDGPLMDMAAVHHAAHVEVAAAVGWSRLDLSTFWRLTRTRGTEADLLPGARPAKIKDYQARFACRLEEDDLVATYAPQPETVAMLRRLKRFGPLVVVALGENIEGRRAALARHNLDGLAERAEKLDADPRRRTAELKALAGGERRVLVVAGSDVLIRAADAAELFAVGVSSGSCTPARLHRAGARVVYPSIAEFVNSLENGAEDLVRAGMPADLVNQ